MKYLLVSLGAALGGTFRYYIANIVHLIFPSYFPFGTLIVNFSGSFLLGIIIFYFDERFIIDPYLKIFLTIGFCGGYTTFSTFSYETLALLKNSEFLLAFANVAVNVFLSLFGIYLSFIIARQL